MFTVNRCTYKGQSATTPNKCEIFSLPAPHHDVLAQYKINNKCILITYDETQAVVITEQQYSTCLHANGQFCKIDVPC